MNRHLPLAALGLLLVGCDEGGIEPLYELNAFDRAGNAYFFTGSARCGPNTSFPDGDPLKGKWFVSAVGESADGGALSLTLHFTDFTDVPDEGTYVHGEGLDASFTHTPPEPEEAQDVDSTGASVTVSGDATARRVDLDGTFPVVDGYLQCPEEE